MTAGNLDSSNLKCSQCTKEFTYESEKRRHELSHSPQFQCSVCSKKFSFVSALRRHEKQHDRSGSVACNNCGRKFRDETLLKRHMSYAHKGTYSCKKCFSTFSSEVALRTHVKTHRPESERQFRCSFDGCKKTFNFSHHLKHHELTHTNKKQHFCNVCSKGFIQLHHLKTHIKTHYVENWLKCIVPNCNKKFSTEYAIKRHLATHGNISNDGITCKLSAKPKNKAKKGAVQNKKVNTNISKSNNSSEKNIKIELDTKNVKSQSNVVNTIPDNVGIVADCKTALGGCLMGGDSGGDDCLCAQMTHSNTETYDLTPIVKKENNSSTDSKLDTERNFCEGCECANKHCTINQIDNTNLYSLNKDDIHPNIEYGVDGVIKLRDTCDIDIPKNVVVRKDIVSNENRIQLVPYNSCKAVLGKCIVSGNGTISENCLCAKMHFDELHVLAEEVEDLTPYPNNSNFNSYDNLIRRE